MTSERLLAEVYKRNGMREFYNEGTYPNLSSTPRTLEALRAHWERLNRLFQKRLESKEAKGNLAICEKLLFDRAD